MSPRVVLQPLCDSCNRAWNRTYWTIAILFLSTLGIAASFLQVGPVQDSVDQFVVTQNAIAMDGGSNHIVAWTNVGNAPYAVFFRRVSPSGAFLGAPTQATPYPEHFVTSPPAVAMNANGSFVIAWTREGNELFAVFLQRYAADGTPQGGITQVSPYPSHFVVDSPSVAMDTYGNFVIAWTREGTAPFAVFFQRYAADGTPQGGIAQVSPYPGHFVVDSPSVAMDSNNGNFVVGWTREGTLPFAVFFQRYAADGTPQGGIAQVSPYPGQLGSC